MLARTRGLADHAEWRAHIAKTRQGPPDGARCPCHAIIQRILNVVSSVCQANAL